jgi:crossover junction endodeoxyribonuclease RuvC
MTDDVQAWWLGVDPGKTGAMCLKSGDEIMIEDWEGVLATTAKLREWKPLIAGAFLEKVHNMPEDGGSSAFRFGTNFGTWQGALAALDIPFKLIDPQMWRKGLFAGVPGKTTKKKSLFVARRMFPESEFFLREKDHDRAEAMLIAYQAERYFYNTRRKK